MIPLVDLKAQYVALKDEIDEAIRLCIDEANFIKGEMVTEFEAAFSKFIGTNFCMGCGNGTDALEIILTSLKIGFGDEVLVPALTWISTAEAVNNVGAEPVFVDINPCNFTIDVTKIREKITTKTKAIIPVHLYGCPADMNEIQRIADEYGIYVIEDCAQAHGAEYSGKKVGSFGIASAFSFFPSKNLGAYGDGGAIITNDKSLAETIRKIANHGQLHAKHTHYIIGRNSRLDTIQAAILNVKLKHLDNWNEKRRRAADYYKSRLKERESIILPINEKNKLHVYHLYVIRSHQRVTLIKHLANEKISCGIHYPKPIPFIDAYNYKKHRLHDFPNATIISDEILSLPLYPEITERQLDRICNEVLKVC